MKKLLPLILLALAGCDDNINSLETENMPYTVGTCFSFEGAFVSRSVGYWPTSRLALENYRDRPPKGSYVFILPVDHKDLTPVSCEGVK